MMTRRKYAENTRTFRIDSSLPKGWGTVGKVERPYTVASKSDYVTQKECRYVHRFGGGAHNNTFCAR